MPDILQKLPGRGVWTQLNAAIVRQAVAKQAFSRGFRVSVKAGPELAEEIDRLLKADALRFLSLVNKSGLVVVGGAKVEAAIRAGAVAGLIQASDGSPDGASKLERLLKGCLGDRAETVARINLFESRRLDLALGRTNVIHAALNAGPASAAFLAKVRTPDPLPVRRVAGGGFERDRRASDARNRRYEAKLRQGLLEERMSETNNTSDKTLGRFCAKSDVAFEAACGAGHRPAKLFPWPEQGRRRREEAPRSRARRGRAARSCARAAAPISLAPKAAAAAPIVAPRGPTTRFRRRRRRRPASFCRH